MSLYIEHYILDGTGSWGELDVQILGLGKYGGTGHNPPPTETFADCGIVHDRLGYWIASAGSGGLQVNRAWHANLAGDSSSKLSGDNTCAVPHLNIAPDGGLHILWRVGLGVNSSPYAFQRAYSYDYGETWTIAAKVGEQTNVKHCRECFNKRTQERMNFRNDGSNGDGTGYLFCDIYQPAQFGGALVKTVPVSGSIVADDVGFDVEYCPDFTHLVDVVFISQGSLIRLRSYDDGDTWKDPNA